MSFYFLQIQEHPTLASTVQPLPQKEKTTFLGNEKFNPLCNPTTTNNTMEYGHLHPISQIDKFCNFMYIKSG